MEGLGESLHRARLAGPRRAKQEKHANGPVLRSKARLEHLYIWNDNVNNVGLAHHLRRKNRGKVFSWLGNLFARASARGIFWAIRHMAGLIIRTKFRGTPC